MRWLDCRLLEGPYLTLCTSEREFKQAMKHIKFEDPTQWVTENFDGTTHEFECWNGKRVIVVCLRRNKQRVLELGLLAHEAMHVWQKVRRSLGNDAGVEVEAQAFQVIFQVLVDDLLRRRRK